jgi:transcriptional regulator with XRE-family HTH domain
MLKLKEQRLRRGWTQQDLAYHARMAAADVSRIESGRLKPYPSQLARLARVLGITPEELMQRTEGHESLMTTGNREGRQPWPA